MHFANRSPARRVYNDILHKNSSTQAHFGPAGLYKIRGFDPRDENRLYLFDAESDKQDVDALHRDIPNAIEEHGDALGLEEFFQDIYNKTAAPSSTILEVLIDNPDIDVLTPAGNSRRKATAIKSGDIIRLNPQKSWFSIFNN